MEQQEAKMDKNQAVEREASESSPLRVVWQGYSRWLKQFMQLWPLIDTVQVNTNPYVRGGTCSYDKFLSGMLRTHCWGLLLPAILAIGPVYLFPQVWTPSQDIMLGIIIVGLIHWACLAFTYHEKRLQASGFGDDKTRMLVWGFIVVFCCGYAISWFMELENLRLTGIFTVKYLDYYNGPLSVEELAQIKKFWIRKGFETLGYTAWDIIGKVMLCAGLVLNYMLPLRRNSDTLPPDVIAELNQKPSYPTAVFLLFNVLILTPIAMFLI